MDNKLPVLPIGSVVMLKNGKKPVMIIGYFQETALIKDMVYDYLGVPYPEGNIHIGVQFGFQMTDIGEVLFTGYVTDDFHPWQNLLNIRAAKYLAED